jgi:hypothetical protein
VPVPALSIVYRNLIELVRLVGQLTSYAVVFVCALVSSRAKTAATIAALRSQVAHRVDRVQQKQEPKPRLTPAFRFVWVGFPGFSMAGRTLPN